MILILYNFILSLMFLLYLQILSLMYRGFNCFQFCIMLSFPLCFRFAFKFKVKCLIPKIRWHTLLKSRQSYSHCRAYVLRYTWWNRRVICFCHVHYKPRVKRYQWNESAKGATDIDLKRHPVTVREHFTL